MGIRNIENLYGDSPVNPAEPTVAPDAGNTTAGIPTPIDNVAREEQAEVEVTEDLEDDSDE